MVDEAREVNPQLDVKLLINRRIPGTRIGRQARDSLAEFNLDILDSELCQRVAFIDAMTSGVSVMQYAPDSKAAIEVENLCDEITLQKAEEEPLIDEPRTQEAESYIQPRDVPGEKPFW
jgi:chromosome partitioning protein